MKKEIRGAGAQVQSRFRFEVNWVWRWVSGTVNYRENFHNLLPVVYRNPNQHSHPALLLQLLLLQVVSALIFIFNITRWIEFFLIFFIIRNPKTSDSDSHVGSLAVMTTMWTNLHDLWFLTRVVVYYFHGNGIMLPLLLLLFFFFLKYFTGRHFSLEE